MTQHIGQWQYNAISRVQADVADKMNVNDKHFYTAQQVDGGALEHDFCL